MNDPKKKSYKNVPVTSRLQNANGKTVAAVVLLSVMAILWGRVLLKGKGGPTTASAQGQPPLEQMTVQEVKPIKITPIELNHVAGRNDVLSGDMFSSELLKETKVEEKPVQTLNPDDTAEKRNLANLEKISNTTKLEAIIRNAEGEPYQVFVDDKILSVGSVLTVKEGPDQYDLVLKAIGNKEATFMWNGNVVTVKITETVDK